MTYDVRPKQMGSWTFLVREGEAAGPVAARVLLKGFRDEGVIEVGPVPFALDRAGFGRAYRLLFEGRPIATAEPQGVFSNGYDLTVEAAVLDEGAAVGERVRFEWAPTSITGGVYDLREGEARVARLEKTSMVFRHFALSLDEGVPLAIGAFGLALTLARLRRQSRSG